MSATFAPLVSSSSAVMGLLYKDNYPIGRKHGVRLTSSSSPVPTQRTGLSSEAFKLNDICIAAYPFVWGPASPAGQIGILRACYRLHGVMFGGGKPRAGDPLPRSAPNDLDKQDSLCMEFSSGVSYFVPSEEPRACRQHGLTDYNVTMKGR